MTPGSVQGAAQRHTHEAHQAAQHNQVPQSVQAVAAQHAPPPAHHAPPPPPPHPTHGHNIDAMA